MQATVNRITQSTHFAANGKAEHTFVVSFNVGDHGPFTLNIPKADFNEINVREQMKKVADEIAKLHAPATP